jgi:limonene 1,2-monooxygenase
MAPFHKVGISPTVHYERDLELIERIDRLGFQEAWIGEHHSGGMEPIGCPELFLTAASQRTQTIRLGTGVNSLPYHNPFLLAERLVLLDHLSHGRAMMGFGPGQLASDAHMLAVEVPKQRDMLLEAAEVIVRLMHGETVTVETEWFKLQDARLQVLPYSLPTLDMVVASVASPSGPRTAGRLGLGMMNLAATGPDAFEALRTHWEITEREAGEHGTTVSRENWRLAGIMHLAETEEQARAECEYGFQDIWSYLGQISPLPVPEATTTEGMIDEANAAGFVCIGTADMAIDLVRRLADQTGGFGVFLMNLTDFAPPEARLRSVELFAERVIPEFRGQLKSLYESRDWVLGQKGAESPTKWKEQTLSAIAAASEQYESERAAGTADPTSS